MSQHDGLPLPSLRSWSRNWFLSDDDYEFEFRPLHLPPSVEDYFPLSGAEDVKFTPDEVILFSGGLDPFAGTVEELVAHGKKVALVSHRSASKITEAQNYLIGQLRGRFGADRVLHIPVRANLKEGLGKEPTHRTRSFLFAAIGAVTGHLLDQAHFFENGVVSLNLPPVGQVVGARATRTTHPQALAGFRRILSAALDQPFDSATPTPGLQNRRSSNVSCKVAAPISSGTREAARAFMP